MKESPLSNKQLSFLKNLLISENGRIGNFNKLSTNIELTSKLDNVTANLDTSFILKLQKRNTFYSKKIKNELMRIEKGDYGICKNCGEKISFERLKARPTAEFCIDCKEDLERMEKFKA